MNIVKHRSHVYIIDMLYLTINSCGTPLVYYLGIEENRKRAHEYWSSNVKIFRGDSNRVLPFSETAIPAVMDNVV